MAITSIQTREVNTLPEFLDAVAELLTNDNQIWFRGQSLLQVGNNCEHRKLMPKVIRKDHDERFLSYTFRLRAKSRYNDCPLLYDYPSWLFLMQHYGLPTRLLDWSTSPLIASFFAAEDRRKDPREKNKETWPDCEVYALNPTILNYYEVEDQSVKNMLVNTFKIGSGTDFQKYKSTGECIDPWGNKWSILFKQPFKGATYFQAAAGDKH